MTTPALDPRQPRKTERESAEDGAAARAGFAALIATLARHTSYNASPGGGMALGVGDRGPVGRGAARSEAAESAAGPDRDGGARRVSAAGERATPAAPARSDRDAVGGARQTADAETAARGREGRTEPHANRPPPAAQAASPGPQTQQSGAQGAPIAGLAPVAPLRSPGPQSSAGVAAVARVGGPGSAGNAGVTPAGVPQFQARPGAHPTATRGRAGKGSHPGGAAAFQAQVARGLAAALQRGNGEVTLRLRPHALGELRVQVSVHGASVEARLRATSGEAHRLLEQNVESLRAALETRGLHVGRIEIEPPPADTRPGEGAAQQWREEGPGSGTSEESGSGSPRDSAAERASGGGAAGAEPGSQDADGGTEPPVPMEHPGVVYSAADGAARIVMIDALA